MDRPEIAIGPEIPADFGWQRVFGNARPVELEIGTGKGGFLLRRAQACPERNFCGIEWANEFYRFALDRMQRWRVPNVRLLRTDAADFVQRVCPRESLAALHVYHPDPWPKRRHHKRRLFQARFVAAAVACLEDGGRWAVQTDHAEYFDVIRALLRAQAELEEVPFDDPQYGVGEGVGEDDVGPATNFEIKYRREGRAIYRIAMRRRGRGVMSNE